MQLEKCHGNTDDSLGNNVPVIFVENKGEYMMSVCGMRKGTIPYSCKKMKC